MIFSRTKHGAEQLKNNLVAHGLKATSVHGNKPQGQRDCASQAFRNGEMDILVAIDVAARGIDIANVGLVLNCYLPNVAENYVHRIGRTAHAGRSSKAISFYTCEERKYLDAIEKLIKIRIRTIGDVPQSAPEDKKSSPKRVKISKKNRFHPQDKVRNSQNPRNGQRHRGRKPLTNKTAA